MNWRKLTRGTYNRPHETPLWHADLMIRLYYVKPIREHLAEPSPLRDLFP